MSTAILTTPAKKQTPAQRRRAIRYGKLPMSPHAKAARMRLLEGNQLRYTRLIDADAAERVACSGNTAAVSEVVYAPAGWMPADANGGQ